MTAKFAAMEDACDELDRLTQGSEGGEEGKYDRMVYDRAMARANPYALERMTGRRATPESRWREARLDGLVPREAWVPTETRGKGWDYGWRRPSGERSVSRALVSKHQLTGVVMAVYRNMHLAPVRPGLLTLWSWSRLLIA